MVREYTCKAILTGHTRGLGAAIAQELLLRGIPVLGLARNLDLKSKQIPSAMLTQEQIDLSVLEQLEAWLAGGALKNFAKGCETLLLINNAGIVQPVGSLEKQEINTIARAVTLNVSAPLMLAAAAAELAASDAKPENRPEVRILHISSGAGSSPYPGWSVYCATKAALDQHARAAALDNPPFVRICSLAPGIIDTDMQTEIRATSQAQFPLREKFVNLKNSGQLTKPEDCAVQLLDFLLSSRFGADPVADLRQLTR